jgi:hypothetical protein
MIVVRAPGTAFAGLRPFKISLGLPTEVGALERIVPRIAQYSKRRLKRRGANWQHKLSLTFIKS